MARPSAHHCEIVETGNGNTQSPVSLVPFARFKRARFDCRAKIPFERTQKR